MPVPWVRGSREPRTTHPGAESEGSDSDAVAKSGLGTML